MNDCEKDLATLKDLYRRQVAWTHEIVTERERLKLLAAYLEAKCALLEHDLEIAKHPGIAEKRPTHAETNPS